MRRFLFVTTAIGLAALPARAEERSLWDLLSPDRILEGVLQNAVMALRTQVDMTYETIDVSVRTGDFSIDGIRIDIPEDVAGVQGCTMTIRSLDLLDLDPFAVDTFGGTIALRDLDLPGSCLGRDALPIIGFLPDGRLQVSDVTLDFVYDIPTSGLTVQSRGTMPDMIAFDLGVDFDYIWGRQSGLSQALSARLSGASVTIENLGAWEVAAPLLPPPFTDPDQAAAAIQQSIGQILTDQAPNGVLPKASKTFVADLAEGWAAFVTDPKRLVIESGFPADQPRVVDGQVVAAIEESPVALIELLEPRVGFDRASERAVLPVELVARARDNADDLSPEERRMVGLALLVGDRAPRNTALATTLLTPIAETGDGEVALALAEALRDRDPEAAYAQALAAGSSGVAGVRSLLNSLEADLPFATVLRLQGAAAEPGASDLRASASEMRARAEAHLRGVGASRSLRSALIYATIASAKGDRAAGDLLAAIDRAVPADGADIWVPVAADAAEIAMDAWLEQGQ
ncbi:hypothetical protein [Jannaschia pohangensis]|uniref:Uncharacterized protein n=1 Tax=Jannaschia pohangensis TaxID=390807 RepID=A0A1I3HQX2_9RHOB|nr:hypothetical protein [Jannaschia pohangensis]SFI37930.1 hypothetical protein SAMN04488095_0680 [Jannaschia pohangensis]